MASFDTAKIRSIDRNKGRIELSMRNGLVSVGTYLYDISTLREGMSVLIGKVDGSHIILNQIENVPRLGTSFSVRRPLQEETGQFLILNFDGVDGATTWTEEVQGLVPISAINAELDTNKKKFGSSSLLLKNSPEVAEVARVLYQFPAFSGDFALHGYLYSDRKDTFVVSGQDGRGWCNLSFGYNGTIGDPPEMAWSNLVGDRNFSVIVNESYLDEPIPMGEWYHFAIIVHGRKIGIFINGTLYREWTANIDNPISLGGISFLRTNCREIIPSDNWVDAFELVNYAKWTTNFTPPTHPPVKGIVTV